MRTFATVLTCVLISVGAFAGGPLLVSSNGVPQTWANGQVTYFTDRGDLSPLLPNAQADQFVADAWSRWTSVPLGNVKVTHGGQLDEDVTGANFPFISDVRGNSGKPLAIVYDADGSVVDALLGLGAGAAELCSTNAVLGSVDQMSADGHIAHALVVIDGNCARKPADLPVLRYQLVRAFGRILGMDYSQLNENVVTGSPGPTGDDYAGYPVMHALGVLCSALSGCIPNADVPRMEDRAALARLYPAAAFAGATARVHGNVRFPSWKGQPGQAMQGVNVVARLVDPNSGRVSRQFAASSVSGFLFRGNAGNPMTGYTNALGDRWDEHGSNDLSLEGYYDLSGLEIPDGYNSATYEVSVEPVNTVYNGSTAVGPYVAGQVLASGAAPSVRVRIGRGAEVAQDFVMQGAVAESWDRWEPSSFAMPAAVPLAGSWSASVSEYGDRDYYLFHSEANRTFTFDVTAVSERGVATSDKLLPVLGAWGLGDDEDAPRLSETYFNTAAAATTRLQAVVSLRGDYVLGVADYRGDGRPDFRYTAHIFYAGTLKPARVGVQGGSVVTIEGLGFTASTQVSIDGVPAAATLAAANQVVFRTPALSDGTYSIVVQDAATGAISEMDTALVVGSAGARLVLLNGANPQVPVGAEAPNPVRVQVVDSNSGIAVAGASVVFSVPSAVGIVGCAQSVCPVITDQNGMASARLLVKQAGASTITVTLPTSGTVYATVNGLAAAMEITVSPQMLYVASGASLTIPIAAFVVGNGVPMPGRTVDFLKNYGAGTITPASAMTGADGVATSQLAVSGVSSDVNLSACVAPADSPCRTVLIHPVASSDLRLTTVSGDAQTVAVGQSFAPVAVRVVDGSGNPVAGAGVSFDVQVSRATGDATQVTNGEVATTHNTAPVILSSSRVTVTSDVAGLATLSAIPAPVESAAVKIRATVGAATLDLQLQSLASLPQNPPTVVPSTAQTGSARGNASSQLRPARGKRN